MRNVLPTKDNGIQMSDDAKIDLAAIDLYRDRERGILKFNQFRRDLRLKPYKTFADLTGEKNTGFFSCFRKAKATPLADELEILYDGNIENIDLLVGDMYEKKLSDGFVLSETSFIIFLLMASRRLDSDPYLNEYYTEEYYTETGLKHIEEVLGMKDLLQRHYPTLAEKIAPGDSAFKPYASDDPWKEAKAKGVIPANILNDWATNKKANDEFFKTGGEPNERTSLM